MSKYRIFYSLRILLSLNGLWLIASALSLPAQAFMPDPDDNPGAWSLFQGGAEHSPNGIELSKLNYPSDIEQFGSQFNVLTKTGDLLDFRQTETGWHYENSFSLPFNRVQRSVMHKNPNQKFLYVCPYLERSIYSVRHDNGLFYNEPELSILAEESLDGCHDLVVSPDGRFLFTVSIKHGNLSIYSIDGQSGRLTLDTVFRSNGESGINGLRGAHSLAVHPDSNEVVVTGSRSNTVVIFSLNGSDWVHSQSISGHEWGEIQNLNSLSLRGIKYDLQGDRLFVVAHEENTVYLFARELSSRSWQLADRISRDDGRLIVDQNLNKFTRPEHLSDPKDLWLVNQQGQNIEVLVACRDGLANYFVNENAFLKREVFYNSSVNPEFQQIVNVIESHNERILVSHSHRVSIVQLDFASATEAATDSGAMSVTGNMVLISPMALMLLAIGLL